MAQTTYNDAGYQGKDLPSTGELSRNDALSLLRLLSPQASERTYFSASVLNTPNGGQLYVTPNLYG